MNAIDAYIDQQDPAIQTRLRAIRDTIREAIPAADERISWGMPTYWKGRDIIHFAAGKRHIGIYPGPEAVAAFGERLQGYKTSKGAIQLPNDRELPLGLVADIARWSYAQVPGSLKNKTALKSACEREKP